MLVSAVSASTPVKETTIDGDYPWIRVDMTGGHEHYVGEQFTISGTTNLPVDYTLIFETMSMSYSPGASNAGEYSGLSETLKVVKGDPYNKWSVDIDTSTFEPDEYIVNVESVETTSTATTSFDLLEKGATATTTKTAGETATTPVPPTISITTAATTNTQTPTATAAAPGFGALAALIALGAAALILRKE
ncbi:PGF-CTERM sorting domain-containing protein [Methanolacinia paynteri]|uniref:PGF-CTERM sorting domain-containing protein n=1 Tax=Methanolacinia paynteri TaxID=230356 RepID=UPI00064F5323|nr:PGF-CTERM sorting domain-containing protein [Methanolacinia paynteri]